MANEAGPRPVLVTSAKNKADAPKAKAKAMLPLSKQLTPLLIP